MSNDLEFSDLLNQASKEVRAALPENTKQAEKASDVIPGGTVRARFWWPIPIFIERGSGAYVTDLDGVRYIDCNLGFGTLVLGHAHPAVADALSAQIPKGVFYGSTNQMEEVWARRLKDNVPGAEKVVFVNSGTEATLAALHIARAATGRDKVAKFEGGWHGWQDFLLHNFMTFDGDVTKPRTVAEAPGIPQSVSDSVVALPYNHRAAFDRIREEASDLACVVVEAVQGGGGAILAEVEFMRELRTVCDEANVLLIVDEVITGFRVAPATASARYGIIPDLVTLGKAIGGGLPAGAVCGRGDLIGLTLAPPLLDTSGRRPVNIAGTFSAHPLTCAAGIAQMDVLLGNSETYPKLAALGDRMRSGLTEIFADLKIDAFVTGIDSIWGMHFSRSAPNSVRDKSQDNTIAARLLSTYLLLEGVLMSSPAHVGFVSTAHTTEDVDSVLAAHRRALTRMQSEGCI